MQHLLNRSLEAYPQGFTATKTRRNDIELGQTALVEKGTGNLEPDAEVDYSRDAGNFHSKFFSFQESRPRTRELLANIDLPIPQLT
jgi:hypothetical protein